MNDQVSSAAPRVHVERTSSPRALRWVCHRPDLERTPVPPEGSHLARMIDDGTLLGVSVDHGDLLVGFPSAENPDDRALVTEVHQAVVEALRSVGWKALDDESVVTIRARSSGQGD